MHRFSTLTRPVTTLAASLLAAGALAAPALPSPALGSGSANYAFTTLDNQKDPTFNQLLGINDSGLIAGYFGSGQTGHPNKGYRLSKPYGPGNYHNENFPGSEQTQVTGLNTSGQTVGFWVDAGGNNSGFYTNHGHFHTANFPTKDGASPRVDQLLGINDSGITVGFYTDKQGTNHGYSYSIARHKFHKLGVSGDTNVTAAAINDPGDMAGFATNGAGTTEAFLLRSDGQVIHLSVPGASATQAFGVNTVTRSSATTRSARATAPSPTASPGRPVSASRRSMTRTEPVERRSTASTTAVTSSASTSTRRATPTASWPTRCSRHLAAPGIWQHRGRSADALRPRALTGSACAP